MQNIPVSFNVEDTPCWLARVGGRPEEPLCLVLVPGAGAEEAPGLARRVAPLVQQGGARAFVLAGFASADWNRDFTPWPAKALFEKEGDFAGNAPATLTWLTQKLLPQLARQTALLPGRENTFIMDYSLAGLFSLWAFYETGLFGGCAACSASLWYEGWLPYAKAHTAKPGSRVYLSLGKAEEKARNPRMAAVGPATRQTAQYLQADPGVAQTQLNWQEGGHFKDVPGRLAAGLAWLVQL